MAKAEQVKALLDRRFHVVVGKGGVGRTLFATALALRSAQSGARTLLLEVNAPDSCAARLGVAPAPDVPREVASDLFLCRMTPDGSLKEYALLILKFKALYNLVFENKLVKYLLRSIPSLAEVTMLGKTWYHTEEELEPGRPRYDRVIVDAPATGHAITFLSVARVVADLSPDGVMKAASEKMAALVESPDQTALHVVSLPEEMPVNEGLDMLAAARGRLHMQPGLAVMNRMLPPIFDAPQRGVLEALAGAAKNRPELVPYLRAGVGRNLREALQAEYLKRFERESGLPTVVLPEFGVPVLDKSHLESVARILDRACGGLGS